MQQNCLLILLLFAAPFSLYPQTHDAELIYQKTNILVKNQKLYKTKSFEIRINNRNGERFTVIAIPYSGMVKITGIEAFIKDREGRIVNSLKNSDIRERSNMYGSSFYSDNYVKEFTLKHNVYPYTICYSYQTVEEEFIILENWVPVLDLSIPTIKAELKLELPLSYKINYTSRFTDGFTSDSAGLSKTYVWNVSYEQIIKPEPYAPSLIDFIPGVTIVPLNFIYGITGSQDSWKSYGNWQNDLMGGLGELPQKEKSQLMALVNGITDTTEQIKVLYHYLQDQTRYINVSIDIGGLLPYPANYVAENKYGDCKALTNYFKAVLDYFGIKSYYTKVYAGDPVKFIDYDFPSQQFNHVILMIPLTKDTVWLDCTSDGPFGYLGSFTQNRPALIVAKDSSHFINTPSLNDKDVLESRKVIMKAPLGGMSEAQFSIFYKGINFEMLSGLSRLYNESQQSQIIRNNFSETGFETGEYSLFLPHRDSAYVKLDFSATSGKVYQIYGNEIILENLPFSLPKFNEPGLRKLPSLINYPIYKTDTLIYEVPDGYQPVSDFSADKEIITSYGEYMMKFLLNENSVMVYKSFMLRPGYYSDDYPEFYDFINKVYECEENTYIILRKTL